MAINIAANTYQPDYVRALGGGLQTGMQLRKSALAEEERRRAQEQQSKLGALAPQIATGDQEALQQALQIDPTGAGFKGALAERGAAQEQTLAQEAQQKEFLARSAYDILQAPPEMQAGMHDDMIRQGIQSGALPEDAAQEIGQFGEDDIVEMQALVRGGQEFKDVVPATPAPITPYQTEQLKIEREKMRTAKAEKAEVRRLKQVEKERKRVVEQQTKETTFIEQKANATESIRLLDELVTHPGLETSVGAKGVTGGFIPFTDAVPGTEAADFMARFEQIKSKAFLEGFQQLKGGGTITEAEGRKAESALTRMDTSQTESAFKAAAKEFSDIIKAGLERQRKAAGIQPEPAQTEGRTATNPQTGEKMIFRGGQWQMQ